MPSRRSFLGWLSGLAAALGLGVRARSTDAAVREIPEQTGALDPALVRSVADAVLPGEVGSDGVQRVSRAFTQWVGAYKPGVELVHPYGSPELRKTGESPAGRWRLQLAGLDRSAREKYRKPFASLTRDQRRELVRSAVAGERVNRLPDPAQANHIALALLSWYFASPEATDLCYNAQIGKNQCRPLVHASRQPLPLKDGGRARGGRSAAT